MNTRTSIPIFVGSGFSADLGLSPDIDPWVPGEDRDPEPDETARDHPSGYITDEGLVNAVNTALLLHKPLLLTGNPGTGKSQLAERLAWELNVSPVLRFEAQSLSEATDLFYRFDLVRQVAASHLAKPAAPDDPQSVDARDFLSFGALGKAILRSNPAAPEHAGFWKRAFPKLPRPNYGALSVVLIDEIDKASRDFPNDLLNSIERLEIPIREIPGAKMRVTPADDLRPVIIITSNSERELPDPFLRRCLYYHIPDPDADTLRKIVRSRVFPEFRGNGTPTHTQENNLPDLFEEILQFFVEQRKTNSSLGYASGPSELIDWSKAVRAGLPKGVSEGGIKANASIVQRAISAFVKHRNDRKAVLDVLKARYGVAGN